MNCARCVLCFAVCITTRVTSSLTLEVDALNVDFDERSQQQQQHEDWSGSALENVQQRNTRPAGCPADFVYLRSVHGCYKVVTDALSWGVAGLRCRKLNSNAHLLIVNDAVEQRTVVEDLVKWYGGCPTGVWTAGQRLYPGTPDDFVWKIVNAVDHPSARVEEMTYRHWAVGDPNSSDGLESCVILWRGGQPQYAWADLVCWGKLCSVCEIDM